ncbi:MAG TPA: peptidoglycan DD-metalloendopeptidase family protein [Bryobacteraceae bacterium]|nr:peptidoglycan DD-metalloendopeptidase family protein [Bryobacteraceae bacterium]
MRSPFFALLGVAALIPAASATTVQQSRLTTLVSEQSCTVPREVTTFASTQRQAFLWFVARQVRAGDELKVEWLDPSGTVSSTAEYPELPNVSEACLTTQLPIAGFAPASQPGLWTVRVLSKGKPLFSRRFQITADADTGGPIVSSVTWSGVKAREIDFTVDGKNFQGNPLVFIAQYTPAGGWKYLFSLQPRNVTANQLVVHYAGLPANEYWVIVQNPDQRLSRPMPFVIVTNGYKLPMPAGEPWVLTQGPYGAFSHWGNALHAYDIAPRSGRCVVAMKAGTVYTHDLGLHQDHRRRTFGNYITIDHGDGEYSHYAHLATGTFVVENGQHVEQGQALAIAGNSGYTLGEGGGYHVHVSVTRALPISSSSIPFQFEDLADAARRATNRTIVSANASPYCDCRERHVTAAAVARAPRSKQFSGQVSVAQWWSELVSVPKGSKTFDVSVEWTGVNSDLDLHLVSPSGRHYGWYGDTAGYSGAKTNPQQFHVPKPEPGIWRISVQGVRGGPGPIDFAVETSGQKMGPSLVASSN